MKRLPSWVSFRVGLQGIRSAVGAVRRLGRHHGGFVKRENQIDRAIRAAFRSVEHGFEEISAAGSSAIESVDRGLEAVRGAGLAASAAFDNLVDAIKQDTQNARAISAIAKHGGPSMETKEGTHTRTLRLLAADLESVELIATADGERFRKRVPIGPGGILGLEVTTCLGVESINEEGRPPDLSSDGPWTGRLYWAADLPLLPDDIEIRATYRPRPGELWRVEGETVVDYRDEEGHRPLAGGEGGPVYPSIAFRGASPLVHYLEELSPSVRPAAPAEASPSRFPSLLEAEEVRTRISAAEDIMSATIQDLEALTGLRVQEIYVKREGPFVPLDRPRDKFPQVWIASLGPVRPPMAVGGWTGGDTPS